MQGEEQEQVAANGTPLSDRLHKVDLKDLLRKLGWNWNWNSSELELENWNSSRPDYSEP
jgi:hypothetical protein